MVPGHACRLALISVAFAGALDNVGSQREGALLQTWDHALDASSTSSGASDTPVTRVVSLLKDMTQTLQKEMDEDKELYNKLACWCNTNEYEKTNAVAASESKISELGSTIESLTARSATLESEIKETEEQVKADQDALAQATALREKQIQEFHGDELDKVQALENLRAAILVLQKHHGSALPQLSLSLLASGVSAAWPADDGVEAQDDSQTKFLDRAAWSADELATIRQAVRSASAFVQAQHGASYYPAYAAQSGEILGILKQLEEQMKADLGEEQKSEQSSGAGFASLREAKTASIKAGEAMAERKEDELAQTNNDLAEAKEDLEQENKQLAELQNFLANLKATCEEADKNFELRTKARLEEIQAVSEAIKILTADDARDAMTGTYSFVQVGTASRRAGNHRARAASLLQRVAARLNDPELSILATSVQLDAFTKVKKAIDDMVAMLKQQQEDEVKKSDWCKAEFQENEMTTMRTETRKTDLIAKSEQEASTIKTLADELDQAKAAIAALKVDLQRASENRKADNVEFQKTVADQKVTQEVLAAALDKLAKYYDKLGFMQSRTGQTPPVPQMEYKPNAGSRSVMSMIEKLIYDARDLQAAAVKSESEAQAQYESIVADTNDSASALQRQVVTKTKEKAQVTQEKMETDKDVVTTVDELEDLSKYKGNLHSECDYVQQNFDIRQQARAQEIEALQQAKEILSGADLSQ